MPPQERVTVGDYLDRWLEDVAMPSLRSGTLAHYRRSVRLHITPALGKQKLKALQPAHLQQLYSSLLAKGLRPKTVRNVHGIIHRALDQAVRWNLAARNVASAVTPPRGARSEMRTLSPEEVRQLIVAARETRWFALLVLAISTGMR